MGAIGEERVRRSRSDCSFDFRSLVQIKQAIKVEGEEALPH